MLPISTCGACRCTKSSTEAVLSYRINNPSILWSSFLPSLKFLVCKWHERALGAPQALTAPICLCLEFLLNTRVLFWDHKSENFVYKALKAISCWYHSDPVTSDIFIPLILSGAKVVQAIYNVSLKVHTWPRRDTWYKLKVVFVLISLCRSRAVWSTL